MEKDKVEVEENNKPQAEVTEKQSVSKTILDNTSEMEKLREENMKLKNENQ